MIARSARVGVIGAGRWGVRLLRQLVSLGVTVVCYPGATPASRQRAASVASVQIYDSVEAVFGDPGLKAIVVATPPHTHADLATRALAAGKHTFVEKPLCLDEGQAGRLRDLAIARDRVLFTGYTLTFHPVVRELAKRCLSEPLRSIWSYRCKTGSFDADVVSTLLVHDLAVADLLGGGLERWEVVERYGLERDPDAVALAFETHSGASGLMRVDRHAPESRREAGLWISERSYRWDGGSQLLEFDGHGFRPAFEDATPALEVELSEFLDAVAAGRVSRTTHERERRLAELFIAVRQAVLR